MRFTKQLAVAAIALAAACTHQVRPVPHLLADSGDRLPLRAKYYLAPTERARVHSDTYFALGKAHTWNIEIGEALATSFPQMLQTVFTSVAAASGPDDVQDADVLLVPAISKFDVTGGDFTSTIEIRVRLAGSVPQAAIEEAFLGTPNEGKAGTAWWGGVFGGEGALRQSAEFAFDDVMPKIRARLKEVLARQSPRT
jgi:hypothetical protein